jgi:alkylation response protein AidB-like acyl-CoA dehydrogenase
MTFRAPIEDFQFVFKHLSGLPQLLELPVFSEAQFDLIDAVLEENAKFTEEVVAPTNRIGDSQPPVCQQGVVTMPKAFHQAFTHFTQGGWQGLRHPQQWGGQGLPKALATATTENLYAANVAFSLCPMLTDGVIEALLLEGSDEQKRTYVEALVAGKWTGTMNLTEPQAGSDLSMVATRAQPQPDGTYRLFGQKIYITYGEHDLAENIIHLVLARTADAPPGVKGLSLFVVPKYLVNADGSLGPRNDVWCASIEHKLGIHSSPTAVLLFGDGKGDVGNGAIGTLVGQENRGLEYMFIMMNAARFAVGVQGIGVSEAATQKALSYARDRIQSRAIEGSAGAVAIVEHPDAHVRQRNQALYDYLVPVVKGFSTECSLEVSSLGIQVHGGMGFIEETGAAQFYRDARILTIYEGTTAIQSNDLVGRKTLRDGGAQARALLAEIRSSIKQVQEAAQSAAASEQPGLKLIADQLALAADAYDRAIQYLLDQAKENIRAVYAGSVPYLMLTGYVLGGWQLARAALVCADPQPNGIDEQFARDKFATAVFYAGAILPRVQALSAAMLQGAIIDDVLSRSALQH